MRGAVLHGPRDVRFEERDVPKIIKPTDAIIRISATCVCGSDLWPYRGISSFDQPTPMGRSDFLAGTSKLHTISPKRLPTLQMKTFPQPIANNNQK